MSRVVTPPQQPQTSTPQVAVPYDKIAMRAYEKWCKKGKPQGTDKQDWFEAESELRAEFSRTSGSTQPRR